MAELCPNCHVGEIPIWKRPFASKPFAVKCPNCGSLLRARERGWLNVAAQATGVVAFWTVMTETSKWFHEGILLGGLLGVVVLVVISLAPSFYGDLEVVRRKD